VPGAELKTGASLLFFFVVTSHLTKSIIIIITQIDESYDTGYLPTPEKCHAYSVGILHSVVNNRKHIDTTATTVIEVMLETVHRMLFRVARHQQQVHQQ
jgi:hypothetical protein